MTLPGSYLKFFVYIHFSCLVFKYFENCHAAQDNGSLCIISLGFPAQ